MTNTNGTLAILTACLAPSRQAAQDHAEQVTLRRANSVFDHIATNGGDLLAAYPRANGKMSRMGYQMASAAHAFAQSVTKEVGPSTRRHGDPIPVVPCYDKLTRVVAAERESAGLQFDAYVVKLASKTGPVVNAKVVTAGAGVWESSVLVVERPDGTSAAFITKRITNVSKLGKLFHQWPTRLRKWPTTGGGTAPPPI